MHNVTNEKRGPGTSGLKKGHYPCTREGHFGLAMTIMLFVSPQVHYTVPM